MCDRQTCEHIGVSHATPYNSPLTPDPKLCPHPFKSTHHLSPMPQRLTSLSLSKLQSNPGAVVVEAVGVNRVSVVPLLNAPRYGFWMWDSKKVGGLGFSRSWGSAPGFRLEEVGV